MIFPITKEMVFNAAVFSVSQGNIRHSFMGGERNLIGYIGEELFLSIFPDAIRQNNFHYDFLHQGKRVDVKTRICNVNPGRNFEFVIKQTKDCQGVDVFVFVAVFSDLTRGILLGWLSSENFFSMAKDVHEGAPMPQGGVYRAGGKQIEICQLNSFGGY